MLKILLKKQIAEVFRTYFYDAKKNKMRSKGAIIGWFIFFIAIMVVLLGGIFTGLSYSLCAGFTEAGMGWMYFLIMGGIAICLGAFGGIFNTFSSLYLAKDNDLLLSMPIPARTIITARLMNVYLLGAMYAATVFVPALIVYWITAGPTAPRIVCGIIQYLIITGIVLLMSCLLGWVVAKLSLKLKNKSFITVLVSLLFIGGYYFVYFKASGFVRTLLQNADVYGAKIKGAAYILYLFGRVGEGSWAAAAVCFAIMAALFVLVWTVLSRSFLSIATAGGNAAKIQYVEKPVREKSVFGALLGKEFGRFTASANYMLNCGLGVLLIPACGVLLLIKGKMICEMAEGVFVNMPDCAAILLCAAFCLVSGMNDMAAPSVSLEGKSLWIPQSLPVEPRAVLRAKMTMQLILTVIPMAFAVICGASIVEAAFPVRLLLCVMPLVYVAFSAVFGTVIAIRMPLLNWTTEVAPIKQSGGVTLSLFGGWAVSIVFAGLYLLIGHRIGAVLYLLIWTIVLAAAGLLLLRWLDTRGAAAFAAL